MQEARRVVLTSSGYNGIEFLQTLLDVEEIHEASFTSVQLASVSFTLVISHCFYSLQSSDTRYPELSSYKALYVAPVAPFESSRSPNVLHKDDRRFRGLERDI